MSKRKYSEEDLQKAINEIKHKKLSCGKASKNMASQKSTIYDHISGISSTSKKGRGYLLSTEEEEALENYIRYVGDRGFPITRKLLKGLVTSIIQADERDRTFNASAGPSDEWCRNFIARHECLSEKMPETQDKGRARMSNATVINHHFDLLESTVQRLGIKEKPSQIFNCDESGFSGEGLLFSAIDVIFTPARIKHAFEKCGLYPVNRDAIDKTQLQPNNDVETEMDQRQKDASSNRIDVQCKECGTTMAITPPPPTNPLWKQGLIPKKLANILMPPVTSAPRRNKSVKIVSEARVLTGAAVIHQLGERGAGARRQEEGKEARKIERIKKREEKERMDEEKRIITEEKKKERQKKGAEIEKSKMRQKNVRERKKMRKENKLTEKCVICKDVDPQCNDIDIIWIQCGVCDAWVYEVCLSVRVNVSDEYMCDECLSMFEE